MKKIILIICMLLAITVKAENIMQFTGGNYIFAENGRLIFNLDPSVLEAREWHYNQATDSFDTEFKTNMQLKTLYTDSFHGYEARLKTQFLQVAYGHSPADRYAFHPVYYKKAFLPAVGWGVRVGATIARQVLPPLIQRCLTNPNCVAGLAGVAIPTAALCGIAYGLNDGNPNVLNAMLPAGVCKKAEQDGYKKDKDGRYKRKFSYSYRCTGGLCLADGGGGGGGGKYGSASAALSAAKANCAGSVSTPMGSASLAGHKSDGISVSCIYRTDEGDHVYESSYGIVGHAVNDDDGNITMIDISRYMTDEIKKNPTPYINSNGLGKDILAFAKLKTTDIQSGLGSGSFSVVGSEPYRDPRTGKTVQDVVTIDSASKNQTSGKSQLSGTAGSGGSGSSGISATTNHVSVNQIGRNDVEDSAKVGRPNSPNGTNGSGKGNNGGSGQGNGTGNGKGNGKGDGAGDGDEKGKCEGLENTVGCMPVGDLPTDTDIEVPGKNDGIMNLTPDNFIPSDGICPAPVSFNFLSMSYSISYEPACEYARKIRMLVILVGTMTAGMLIFKGFK
ncbi:virulence factor TspB C-terminal domain-related protein [Snodgrassella alvi]|nr:virulence factor TspB C-terminal domain-related protein [Snodgrassella alvi]